jgi:tetratricopeptide (TPR) repeat protein
MYAPMAPLRLLLLFVLGIFTQLAWSQRDMASSSSSELLQSAIIDAHSLLIRGQADKAEEIVLDLVRKNPNNDAVAYLMAQILAEKEDLAGALREIQRARNLDNTNVWYPIMHADLLEQTGGFAEAARIYEALTKQYPGREDYYIQWAFFLIKDGRPEEALKVYDRIEKTLGPSSETSRKKYMLLRGMGRHRDAARVLEEVLARKPRDMEVMYLLADFYAETGAIPQARQWYERILEIHPGETEARFALVRLSDPSAPDDDLLAGLERIFANPRADLDQKIKAILPHIQEFADAGNNELGQRLFSLAHQLSSAHPGDPKVSSILGDLHFYHDDLDEALLHYRNALSKEKRIYPIWEQLLLITSRTRRYTEQLQWAEDALDYHPNQVRILFFLIEAQVELRQPVEALQNLRMATMMARNDGFLLYHLGILEGRSLMLQGLLLKAEEAFDRALELNGSGSEAMAYRAISHADTALVCDQAKKSAAIDQRTPLVRFAQAHCLFIRGDHAQAKTILEDLQSKPYPHPLWTERLGDLYALAGQHDAALSLWRKAGEHGAGSASLSQKIATGQYIP